MAAKWRVAWVTGASTGIGRELAIKLAKTGVKVAVSARSGDKLAELARLQPSIMAFQLDVSDLEASRTCVAEIEATLGPIDLAVLNAGAWAPMTIDQFDAAIIAQTTAVNFNGVVNGVDALLPRMMTRASGHIGIVASVAGYRGLPRSAAYGPTKAALINLAETLASEAHSRGVAISVINPGFVETPMTSVNKFPMPFIMSAETAAGHIVRGLEKGAFEIAFPWQLVTLLKLARVMPYPLFFWFARTVLSPRKT